MTLGSSFYTAAGLPLLTFASCLQRGDMPTALNAVHGQRLVGAFHTAVNDVAREAGVTHDVVLRMLPTAEAEATAAGAVEKQASAVEVWNQHHGSLSGFLTGFVGGFVEAHFGIEGSGVGDWLSSIGNKLVQDTRLAEPINELFVALQSYDQVLARCASVLDASPVLGQGVRRTRQRRLAKRILVWSLVLGVAIAAGGWAWSAFGRSAVAELSTSPSATASSTSAPTAAARLAGRWTDSTGAVLDASVAGDTVVFRVGDAKQFPRQGRAAGDIRFSLTTLPEEQAVFAVDDRVQPIPPRGVEYEPGGAPTSCREIWHEVGGKPLLARVDGSRLSVEIVKLEATAAQFRSAKAKVSSCENLTSARAARAELSLNRIEPGRP